MSTQGRVEAIHIARESGAPMESVDEIEAVEGKGLRGDRYFDDEGTWSNNPQARDIRRDLTLFEAETLDVLRRDHDLALDPADHRRNITTDGVAVDHLLDRRFRIGEVVCSGIEICEPCAHLESLTEDGVLQALVHRGGLNAVIETTGTIRVGDRIVVE